VTSCDCPNIGTQAVAACQKERIRSPSAVVSSRQ
jgi:hypothetical protein